MAGPCDITSGEEGRAQKTHTQHKRKGPRSRLLLSFVEITVSGCELLPTSLMEERHEHGYCMALELEGEGGGGSREMEMERERETGDEIKAGATEPKDKIELA